MVSGYAASLVRSGGVSEQEALAESERQTHDLLPDGERTAGELIFYALAGGERVGRLWLSMPGANLRPLAWIADIRVFPEFRSRGYGTAIMRAAEELFRERGIRRVGLHVFGYNTGAQRLYARLGYEILSQVWIYADKSESEVILRRMTEDRFAEFVEEILATDRAAITHDPGSDRLRARRLVERIKTSLQYAYVAEIAGRPVGRVWFGEPSRTITPVHYVEGRGHGRAILNAVAAQTSGTGLSLFLTAGVHHEALAFARRLNMTMVSQQMAKDLVDTARP